MTKDTISYEDAFGPTSASPASQTSSLSYEDAFDVPPPSPKRRTLASIANDTVIEAANAAAGGVSAAANFVKPGNAISGWIDKNIVEAGEASQSDVTKAAKQRFQQEVAGADGAMDELGAVGRYLVDNPLLSAAQAVGSFVGPGAAVKGGRTLASIAGLNAARGGLAGGAAAGAAMAGGDAAGTAYELSTKGGATDEQAVATGRQASVIPAIIGGVGGVVGAERLVAGAKGFAGNAASRALKTAGVEGAQEAIEEGVTQYEGQRAAMPYDATIDPSKGVAAAAGMGAALGGATGGGVSLLTGGHHQAGAPARVNADDPSVGVDAAAPSAPAQATPAIDPTAGPVSKAASKVEGLALEPQEPAAATPTAAPQPSMAALAAQVENLPADVRRDARFTLTELQRQDLPPGVRAFHESQLRSLMGEPVPEVAPVDQQPVGELVRPFDARQPTHGTPAWLSRYQNEQWQDEQYPERAAALDRLPQEYQLASSYFRDGQWDALKEHFHATGGPRQDEAALDAAFATLMSKDRAVAPDARVEALRVINDSLDDELGDFGTDQQIDAEQPHLSLAPKQPAQYEGGIDFEAAPRGTRARTGPAPGADAQTIARLALAENIEPGQPLQLNRAHALRRAAAAEGLAMTVVPHASGRGYDVAPTARLHPAARAAMPQGEAAAMLPFDQSATGRMVAGTDGRVRAEARPEAVARGNTAVAQRQQVQAERQRRAELGLSNITPVVSVTQAGNPASPRVAFDNAPTGRMVAGEEGVRAERRAEVVNRANQAAQAPQTVASASGAPFVSQQVAQQALQRRQLAGTHEVVPAGGDESLGFVLQKKGENQHQALESKAQIATDSVADRAPNWRTNAMQANRVARGLGLDAKGKRLAQVVAEIEAYDLAQNQGSELTGKSSAAIDSVAKVPNPQAAALDMRNAELAEDEAQNGPYPQQAALRNGDGQWVPAVKSGPDGGQAIEGAPVFSDAGAAAHWGQLEQLKSRKGADVDSLVRQQGLLTNPPNDSGSTPAARAASIARGLRDEIDNVSAPGKRAVLYREKAQYLRDAADGMDSASEALESFTAAADMLEAWAGQVGAPAASPAPAIKKPAAPLTDGGATVLYNTSDSAPPARGLSLEQAQQAVQQALAGLANPPPIDIVMRSQELGVGTPDGVMGAAIPGEGRIVLVASAHGSADAVIETVFHEMFHLGVRNVLPSQDYVQAMLDLAKRDSRVQEYANKWKKEAPDAPLQLQVLRDLGHTGSELTAWYEALAIEEGLAVVAEELRAQKQAGTRLGLRVRALANWLANVAERMGMQRLAERIRKMTYNEAERFVLKAIEHAGLGPISRGDAGGTRYRAADQTSTSAFQRWFGESQAVDAAGQPLRVFHGTGGDFSVFSRGRAGTATGAANTGMGFFFTDNAEVAGNYARMSRDAQAIMPAYLSLQNPLRLEAKNMMEADKLLLSGLKPENDGAIIRVAMRDGGAQTVYMVREPGQIKSATGNRGTFDPGNADIRYRVQGENPMAERVGDALKAVTVANLKQQAGFKATDYMGLGLQLLGRRQLVDVYGKLLPQLTTYNGLMAQMDADKNEAGAGADELATAWGKLDEHPKFGLGPAKYPGMERKLAELMHDATLAQIDPAKDFVDGDNKTDWNRLRAQYQVLSPAAKDVYARARDTYSDHTSEVRKAIKERIERSGMGGERKDALLQRMDDELFGRIKGVYFPLARFGQYLVVVKDGEGKTVNVSRAETMAEAQAARQQLQTPFPASKGFTVGKVLKAKEFIADRDAVGRGFMEQLYGVLDKQSMDSKQKAELEDALGQLYLSAMPDLSWAKHGIHRKGTPGFSQDARRAFAQNVFHGARYLAKLRYSDLLQDELNAMDKHVSARDADQAYDSVRARQVVDEMNKRHDAAMNPQGNPLSTALTSAGFVFYLGLSPASAMVNLSQTALVAYPVMAAKWGYAKSAAALLSASKQAAVNRNDISSALNADEKAAYDEAVRAGVIDVTMAHDLAGIAQGEDSGVMWKVRPVMKWASFLFHHAEKFNRQVTFVAAYRLAREGGADATQAYADAAKATYDGHFDYSSNNRPRVMQGNAARVLLLFKQFGQNMVYTVARQAQQSLKGATPKERAEARKALGGLLAMHGMAAGVLGLPMVTTLLAAASMLGGDDDEPWDAQVALQNMLADTFGQKPAEVLAHGFSRLTPWDISGRVGLDRLILPDLQEGLEGQRLGESAMAAALGPVAGIFVNLFKGVQEMGEGRYMRGLETMMPTVLRGPLKTLRYANEGAQDKSGVSILDEVDAAGVGGQIIGLSPSNVRNAQEGKSAIVAHDRALQQRRSALVAQFAMAAMAGDEKGKVDARESIARFNEKNPDRRILPMQLAQSVRMRTKRIEQAQDGVYLPTKRRGAMDVGRFATGE